MSRYIDADALKEECYKFANDVSRSTMAFVQGQINAAPTANVAPIADTVREMQERLTSFFDNDEFLETAEVDAEYINEQIVNVAKEMLEGL